MALNQNSKGFSLVEMVVVVVVAGLLVAGTLEGAALVRSAKITATIAQIENYRSAVESFYKTYGSLPGDMAQAERKLPDCAAADDGDFQGCNPLATASYGCIAADSNICDNYCPVADFASKPKCYNFCKTIIAGSTEATCDASYPALVYTKDQVWQLQENAASDLSGGYLEDGAIGKVSWDMLSYRGFFVVANPINADNAADAETVLFWYELKKAGFSIDVTDAGLRAITGRTSFGKSHPYAELGGGFWVGHSDGCCGKKQAGANRLDTGRPSGAGNFSLNGNILVLTVNPFGSKDAVSGKTAYICSGSPISCTWKSATSWNLNQNAYDNVISPAEAALIDSKLDDGTPKNGFIQPYGDGDSCYKFDDNGNYIYDESVHYKYCGLYIRIK